MNEKYHVYPITTEDFFKEATLQSFVGEERLLPSEEGCFKMLLNHHGGRECWLRLKELFDLALFLRKSEAGEEDLKRWASEVRMDRVFTTGKDLNELLQGGDQGRSKVGKKVIKFWERGESYDRDLWLKISKMRVYFDLQNPDISRLHLLKRYALYHGSNTPLYEKYYRPFGGRSPALNFMAKMGTIFYRGVQGPYK